MEDFLKKSEYIGEFKDNMKDGYGEEKYCDGSIYKGEFRQDMKHGKGVLLLQGNGNYGYEGEFKKDKISGKVNLNGMKKKNILGIGIIMRYVDMVLY